MARAMSSLPVPVSPRTNTVESVEATRSTCSSTASSAGLLPMICSNLRSPHPEQSEPITSETATGDLLKRLPQPLAPSTFKCRSNVFQQNFIIERFCQKLHGATAQCLQTQFRIAMRGNENSRYSAVLGV